MRQYFFILLFILFTCSAQAQMVGATSQDHSSQVKTGFLRGQNNTKKGTRIFGIGCCAGLGAGLIGAAISEDAVIGIVGLASGAFWGAVFATPFWIKGSREKRGYVSYIPMLEYDVPINEHISLNTSLGTIHSGFTPGGLGVQEPIPGLGVNLAF